VPDASPAADSRIAKRKLSAPIPPKHEHWPHSRAGIRDLTRHRIALMMVTAGNFTNLG
jgi:hypothetical protein